jgi:hypothetical protein
MRSQRTIWTIAAAAAALALGAFAFRQSIGGNPAVAKRDQLVAQMIERLEMDPRVRSTETRSMVEVVAKYCKDPDLVSAETWYAEGLRAYYGDSNAVAA